jgi:hypothetical protein
LRDLRKLPVAAFAAVLLVGCAANPEPSPAPVSVADTSPQPSPSADPVGDLIAARPDEIPPPVVAEPLPAVPAAAASATDTRTLAAYLAGLRATSCPAGTRRVEPEDLALNVRTVPLQTINPRRKNLGALTFAGGFHLTSDDERWGGLSGLAVLPDGGLLSVSDQGDMVWIDLDADGVTPAAARIASLKDAGGATLRGKADGDAEGLAVNDGLALVSFERNHRVLAYDVGGCGAAARGAPVRYGAFGGEIPAAFKSAGIDVTPNAGPEPLAVTRDWYLFTGLETKDDGAGPLSARPIEAAPEFRLRLGRDAPEFVGLDVVPVSGDSDDVRAFSLHRAFNPLSGNAIAIIETRFERWFDQSNLPARIVSEIDERSRYRFRAKDSRTLAQMNVLFTIDNFEGVAARQMPDGRIRLYVISDNNFSSSQRTLLFVFDLPA